LTGAARSLDKNPDSPQTSSTPDTDMYVQCSFAAAGSSRCSFLWYAVSWAIRSGRKRLADDRDEIEAAAA
jgi:hypothetical protein